MATDKIEKGDVVRINYKAYIADVDRLYDTTDETLAKEAGIYNEKCAYVPMPYIVGSDKLFKALDKAILDATVGEETTVEIASADAAGPRNPKLIETYSVREFQKQKIVPSPGLEVKLGNRTGTVISAGAGRVRVDFNNPLAGKDLKYIFTVTEIVRDADEKAKAVIEMAFGNSNGFSFNISEEKVSISLPDIVKFSREWPIIKFKVVSDMRDVFKVNTVEIIEIWSKANSTEKSTDDKKDE